VDCHSRPSRFEETRGGVAPPLVPVLFFPSLPNPLDRSSAPFFASHYVSTPHVHAMCIWTGGKNTQEDRNFSGCGASLFFFSPPTEAASFRTDVSLTPTHSPPSETQSSLHHTPQTHPLDKAYEPRDLSILKSMPPILLLASTHKEKTYGLSLLCGWGPALSQ